MTAFAKCRIEGAGAEKFLDYIFANSMPKKIGRLVLAHALSPRGGVHSEFTIFKESPNSFYLVSAGGSQRLDHDWIKMHLPNDNSVRFTDLTNSMGVLVLAGPKSRALLQNLTMTDLSNHNFPWLSFQKIDVNLAPCLSCKSQFCW